MCVCIVHSLHPRARQSLTLAVALLRERERTKAHGLDRSFLVDLRGIEMRGGGSSGANARSSGKLIVSDIGGGGGTKPISLSLSLSTVYPSSILPKDKCFFRQLFAFFVFHSRVEKKK